MKLNREEKLKVYIELIAIADDEAGHNGVKS